MSQTTSSVDPSAGQRTTLGVLVHLIGFVFGGMVFGFIGPGIVYFFSDNEFTKSNARNSLNWWLLMFGVTIVILAVVTFVFTLGDIFSILAVLLGSIFGFVGLVFSIWAAIKANSGEVWKYPFAPNLI